MRYRDKGFWASILLSYFILSYNCLDQNGFSIKGRIVDEKGQPVPFASIQLEENSTGVISGENGSFKIGVTDSRPRVLLVSAIGYKRSRNQVSPTASTVEIVISSDLIQLNEIYVFPDSSLKSILSKAYRRIEQNYPQRPIELIGFYRSYNKDPEGNRYTTFTESVLRLQESGYQVSPQDAQVEALKVRNFIFQQRDSIDNVRYYGGPFIANWNDPVKMRESFLNPSSFNKKFNYQVKEIITYNQGSDTLYVIQFRSVGKDETKNGSIWIDKGTFVYKRIEWADTNPRNPNLLTPIVRKERRFTAIYQMVNNINFLGYTCVNGINFNKHTRKPIFYFLDFITTSHNINSEFIPIPISNRLSFGTLFTEIKDSQDADFWTEYSQIERDSTFISSKELGITNADAASIRESFRNDTQHKAFRDWMFIATRNLSFGYGLSGFLYKSKSSENVELIYRGHKIDSATSPSSSGTLGFQVSVAYNVNKRGSFLWDFAESLSSRSLYKMNSLGFSQHFLIKKVGNPIFINTYFGLSIGRNGVSLGSIHVDEGILIAGKNIGNDSKLFLGQRQFNGLFGLGVEAKKRRLSYFADIRYAKKISRQEIVVFRTNGGFLFQKNIVKKYPLNDISVNADQVYKGVLPVILTLGVRLGLLN